MGLRRRQQRRSMLSWAERGDDDTAAAADDNAPPDSIAEKLENEVNAALGAEDEAPEKRNDNLDINQNGIGEPTDENGATSTMDRNDDQNWRYEDEKLRQENIEKERKLK